MSLYEAEQSIADKIAGLEGEPENTPADPPVDPAAGEVTPPAIPEGEPEGDKLYAGKYKSPEDLESAYSALESKLGEMGNELGELKKLVQPEEPQPQHIPLTNDVVEWITEQAQERPADAAVWALQNQPALYDTVMETWFEIDPRRASQFERRLEMESIQRQFEEKLAPIAGPVRAQGELGALNGAFEKVKQELPDLDAMAPAMQQAVETMPHLQMILASGQPDAREQFFKALYFAAKGLSGGTPTPEVIAASSAEEARRLANLAGSTTSAHPARVQVTPADQAELDLRVGIREAAGLPTDDLLGQ